MNNKNCYLILHLSSKATQAEIKKSYHKLAVLYHPDKPGGDEHKFKVIKKAYDILTGKETPKAQPRPRPTQTQNYNTRTMAPPEFLCLDVREVEDHYEIEVMVRNVAKVYISGSPISYPIPHQYQYTKSMITVTIDLSYEDAAMLKYRVEFEILGTDGKRYHFGQERFIPKPKKGLKNLFNNIW